MPEHLAAPVEFLSSDTEPAKPGIGLCLSGGGYRAMLFHLGALWRLAELGFLSARGVEPFGRLERISSVSGGSITSAVLGMKWTRLRVDEPGLIDRFVDEVVEPIRALASRTVIGLGSGLGAMILPGSINEYVAKQYREHLFGGATLQALPDHPRFVINATNLQSGALWRFMKPYMADWKVGRVDRPTLALARAVAASSAFPPFLSPARLKLRESDYAAGSGAELQHPPFTTEPTLSDGGVYDNLGLETVWKRCQTVLVSNGGGQMQPQAKVHGDWARQSYRVLWVIDNQVRSLRTRQLVASYLSNERKGAYWGISTDINEYRAAATLPCPHVQTIKLAQVATDLEKKPAIIQERLINWGYGICDAALRSYVVGSASAPGGFPYPASASRLRP